MSEKRAPYNLALVRDALGQSGIDEGAKLSKGLRVGSREVPAGLGDLWLENSIRYSTALSAGLTLADYTLAVGVSWISIPFDTEVWDTDDMADLGTSPTRLTINTGGIYQAHGFFTFAAGGSGTRLISIYKNNTTQLAALYHFAITNALAVFVDALWQFDEGDYLELRAYHDLVATLDITNCMFSAARIA